MNWDDEGEVEEPGRKRSRVLGPLGDEYLPEAQKPRAPSGKRGRNVEELAEVNSGQIPELNKSKRRRIRQSNQMNHEAANEDLDPLFHTLKRARHMEKVLDGNGSEDVDVDQPARKRSRNMPEGADRTFSEGLRQRKPLTNASGNKARTSLIGARSGFCAQYTGQHSQQRTEQYTETTPVGRSRDFANQTSEHGSPAPSSIPTLQNHKETQRSGISEGLGTSNKPAIYITNSRTQSDPIYGSQSNSSIPAFESHIYTPMENSLTGNRFESLHNAVNYAGQQGRMVEPDVVRIAFPSGLQQPSHFKNGSSSTEQFIREIYSQENGSENGAESFELSDQEARSMHDFLSHHLSQAEKREILLMVKSGGPENMVQQNVYSNGTIIPAQHNHPLATNLGDSPYFGLQERFVETTLQHGGSYCEEPMVNDLNGDYSIQTRGEEIISSYPDLFDFGTQFNPHGSPKLDVNELAQGVHGHGIAVADEETIVQPNYRQPRDDHSTSALSDLTPSDLQ